MKLITIIGARPQFIKAAPFSETFRKENEEILVHTGQHYDENMSNIFFDELKIPKPDYNLSVGSGSHGKQTAKMLEGIEEIILKENPDGILVYGDTNSTLAGALAASKLLLPVFHVEAGLRSYNKNMPEEQNRILTDHISTLLLCPTRTAINNLKTEGIEKGVIYTGDIMYDAVLRNTKISDRKYKNSEWNYLEEKNYYLSTIHRAENTDKKEKLKDIFIALNKLNKPVVMPIHPRTKKKIKDLNLPLDNIKIIEPVGYLLMLYLIKNANMVITDSGGLQKEAYFLKIPCTTLRDQTEWVETLENDWNVLSEIKVDSIVGKINRNLKFIQKPQTKAFGNGDASEKIYESIIKYHQRGVSCD